jgi:hypothetical protein
MNKENLLNMKKLKTYKSIRSVEIEIDPILFYKDIGERKKQFSWIYKNLKDESYYVVCTKELFTPDGFVMNKPYGDKIDYQIIKYVPEDGKLVLKLDLTMDGYIGVDPKFRFNNETFMIRGYEHSICKIIGLDISDDKDNEENITTNYTNFLNEDIKLTVDPNINNFANGLKYTIDTANYMGIQGTTIMSPSIHKIDHSFKHIQIEVINKSFNTAAIEWMTYTLKEETITQHKKDMLLLMNHLIDGSYNIIHTTNDKRHKKTIIPVRNSIMSEEDGALFLELEIPGHLSNKVFNDLSFHIEYKLKDSYYGLLNDYQCKIVISPFIRCPATSDNLHKQEEWKDAILRMTKQSFIPNLENIKLIVSLDHEDNKIIDNGFLEHIKNIKF